jgi:flavin-dependent dehydrogenase
MLKTERVDVLVIGAGPSGTVAASIINKSGFKVKIVEKEQFPRFVIGESLLPRCMEPLEEAGFLDILKAQGYQEKNGAKFVDSGMRSMDFSFGDQFTKGWSWTWQVPRAHFDMTLATAVQGMGVEVEFKTPVTSIQFNGTDSVTTVQEPDGTYKEIHARYIVDASGYGRVIPRLFNLDAPSNLPPRKTLFTHIRDTRRNQFIEPNRILIIDHKPGIWSWCIPFSDGVTSCGFVGDPAFFDDFSGTPEEMLRNIISTNPHIAERFHESDFLFEPRTMEGWSVTTSKFYGDGFILTGNVTEFLDPIFSSGVTLATVSAQKAAHAVIRFLQGENVDWEKEYMLPVQQGVDTFRTYVMSWYDGSLQKIFFSDVRDEKIISQICSVLAGYVNDPANPYASDHAKQISNLTRLLELKAKIDQGNAIIQQS